MRGRKLFLLAFPPVSPGSLGTFFCVCEEVMKEAGEMDSQMLSQGVGAGTWAHPQPRRSEEEEKPELLAFPERARFRNEDCLPLPRTPLPVTALSVQHSACRGSIRPCEGIELAAGPSQLWQLPGASLLSVFTICQQSPGSPAVRFWRDQTLMPLAEPGP